MFAFSAFYPTSDNVDVIGFRAFGGYAGLCACCSVILERCKGVLAVSVCCRERRGQESSREDGPDQPEEMAEQGAVASAPM